VALLALLPVDIAGFCSGGGNEEPAITSKSLLSLRERQKMVSLGRCGFYGAFFVACHDYELVHITRNGNCKFCSADVEFLRGI